VSELEKRIGRLEDLHDLRMLKFRYAALCDAFAAAAAASVFAEDGIFDLGEELGTFIGRDAIQSLFEETWADFEWAIHLMSNEELSVTADGREGGGVWRLWEPAVVRGQAVWIGGTYVDRYRKVEGAWHIATSTLRLEAVSPYERGWAECRFVALRRQLENEI
jgi:hypothetical protein